MRFAFIPTFYGRKIGGVISLLYFMDRLSQSRALYLAGTFFTFLWLSGCQDPAMTDVRHVLDSAKQTIEVAKQGGAMSFAPELLGLAEIELLTGEKEFQTQQSKVFWGRDFSLALRLGNLAQLDAEKALSLTNGPVPSPSNLPPSQHQSLLPETHR